VSPRRAALIAGIGYLIIFVLAIFANFFVVEGLVVPGDATATVDNITGSEGLFRSGLVAFAPTILGVLLMLAGAAYVLDTVADALLANYDDYATLFLAIVAVPSVIAESRSPSGCCGRAARHSTPSQRPRRR
jgi:hypothetical protein